MDMLCGQLRGTATVTNETIARKIKILFTKLLVHAGETARAWMCMRPMTTKLKTQKYAKEQEKNP
jgi:hypothetical protein